jgi:hypothetical protein
VNGNSDLLVGILVFVGIFAFLWWWFGLKALLTIAVISAVALVVIGIYVTKKK